MQHPGGASPRFAHGGVSAGKAKREQMSDTFESRGIAEEDQLVYDEPPGWMQPVRHPLGAFLMSTGRLQTSSQRYRPHPRH